MTKPVRLQLSRKKGFNLQELSLATNGLPAVNVARPSIYSNPFQIGKPSGYLFNDGGDPAPLIPAMSREKCVEFFEQMARGILSPEMHPWGHRWNERIVSDRGGFHRLKYDLRARNVACWCGPNDLCHGDVWLRLCEEV